MKQKSGQPDNQAIQQSSTKKCGLTSTRDYRAPKPTLTLLPQSTNNPTAHQSDRQSTRDLITNIPSMNMEKRTNITNQTLTKRSLSNKQHSDHK